MSAGALVEDASNEQDFESCNTFAFAFLSEMVFDFSSPQLNDSLVFVTSLLLSTL
jgi:hypothetical protein